MQVKLILLNKTHIHIQISKRLKLLKFNNNRLSRMYEPMTIIHEY